jgi:hypothetical protein
MQHSVRLKIHISELKVSSGLTMCATQVCDTKNVLSYILYLLCRAYMNPLFWLNLVGNPY